MRFKSILLHHYGCFESQNIELAGTKGLTILYGPNETGKSTCLSGILDFLFGIPTNSIHGQTFGYDKMRLTMTVGTHEGGDLTLTRKKGRGTARTLLDVRNQIVDESALANGLGPMNRERFTALFGLDHETLRSGGEQLLAADGEIGRLIVEAGGGLRNLVNMMAELSKQADILFSTRRSAERVFYQALDEFESAEKSAKGALLTREAFEDAEKRHASAAAELEALRSRKFTLHALASKSQRLIRVLPTLRELRKLELDLENYSLVASINRNFPEEVQEASQAHEVAATVALAAEKAREGLSNRIDELVVTVALVGAETKIRDISERAAHISKARADRPKRIAELAAAEAKLAGLRRSVGLTKEEDLEPHLPSQTAITAVQVLAARGLELRTQVPTLKDHVRDEEDALNRLKRRQEAREGAGQNKASGITSSEFSGIASSTRALDAKRSQLIGFEKKLNAQLVELGFSSLDIALEAKFPDPEVVQSEIERRNLCEAVLQKSREVISECESKRDAAISEKLRLERGGVLPTVEAIAAERLARNEAWNGIRSRYLADVSAVEPNEVRQGSVAEFEEKLQSADGLVDRRSQEAQRIAALELAEKQLSEASAMLKIAERTHRLEQKSVGEAVESWENAWPSLESQKKELGRCKAISLDHKRLVELSHRALDLANEIDVMQAEAEPTLELLRRVEEEQKIVPALNASLVSRVQIVTQYIVSHDAAYAEYRQEERAEHDLELSLRRKEVALKKVEADLSDWIGQWTATVKLIGLTPEVTPESANEVATQWAAAIGVLGEVKVTNTRLSRMDEDEAELKQLILLLAPALEFPLPEDSVVAAGMLHEKWDAARKIAIEKDSLAPQLKQRVQEQDEKNKVLELAKMRLKSLRDKAGCEESQLGDVADRVVVRRQLVDRQTQLLESLAASGDGYSRSALERDVEDKDIDALKADQSSTEQELNSIDDDIELAVKASHETSRILQQFLPEEGVNKAIALREASAVKMRDAVTRYVEVKMAGQLLSAAIDRLRAEQQDPLVLRASELFCRATRGSFEGLEADVDDKGAPVIVGRRPGGVSVPIRAMSDGVRDQLFLAFRLASIERYCSASEPLPFIGDDILVHFDEERTAAALEMLAEFAAKTQVLIFTHHRGVRDIAAALAATLPISVIDMKAA